MRGRALVPVASAALAVLAALAGCSSARPGSPLSVPAGAVRRSKASRVVVVVMENAEYGEVIGNPSAPYINSLARRFGLARASFAVTHPSLPNYVALTSGSTHGISEDCGGCRVMGANIVDQLERAGRSWGAYMEDAPGPCYGEAQSGGYVIKHNPFMHYRDISGSRARCAKVVGFGRLGADLRAGRLPAFTWITPNLCDDGHSCPLSGADRFLARTVPTLLPALGPRGFLVLTWDEGTSDRGCCGGAHGGHVVTIVAGPDVRPGARSSEPVDHYGVLGTIEAAFGLPALGDAGDPRSGRLGPLFARAPHVG